MLRIKREPKLENNVSKHEIIQKKSIEEIVNDYKIKKKTKKTMYKSNANIKLKILAQTKRSLTQQIYLKRFILLFFLLFRTPK